MDRPRSYIYAHKNLNIWPIDSLTTRDVATCIIDPPRGFSNKILIVSIYWDGRIDTFPEEGEKAIKLAREKDYTLVVGGDLNARNILYGSNTTDKRGFVIEDLLVKYDLEIGNRGKKPTCMASDKGSIIDATFTNGEREVITDWKVSNLDSFSDHRIITFNLKCEEPESNTRRKMNDTQKETFTRQTRAIAHESTDEITTSNC